MQAPLSHISWVHSNASPVQGEPVALDGWTQAAPKSQKSWVHSLPSLKQAEPGLMAG